MLSASAACPRSFDATIARRSMAQAMAWRTRGPVVAAGGLAHGLVLRLGQAAVDDAEVQVGDERRARLDQVKADLARAQHLDRLQDLAPGLPVRAGQQRIADRVERVADVVGADR